MAFCFVLFGCGDKAAEQRDQALTFVSGWFQQAIVGERDDGLCHGLGVLKHPAVTCSEMLASAAGIDPASREVEAITALDCFGDVCGTFIELRFLSRDPAGNEVRETALLKQDEGRMRMYWYRNDELMRTLQADDPSPEESDKDPEQLAYDEIVARYPSLYAYPPCYGKRASSSNLAGELMAKDDIDVDAVQALAESCGEAFCFALVGNKIAPLCPN